MATTLDLTALNPALKEFYDDQKVQNLVYEEKPLLAMVPKKTNAGGKYIPVPVIFETNQGGSGTFSNAQANQAPLQIAEFNVTRKELFNIATINNHALEAAATDKMSFVEASTALIDGAIRGSAINASSQLFRSGTGTRGKISSITSGVITLTNAADVVQFGLNQTLQVAATDGGTPRTALGYVISRNVQSGTVTVASSGLGGTAATRTSWTTSDFILVQGDSNTCMSGLPGWLPATAPSSGSNFYGVDRSVDSRLYGLNYDGSAQPIEEALIDHSMLLAREGSSPDHHVMNYGTYGALMKALGAKKQLVDFKGPADISFSGVVVHGGSSAIKVFADRSCQALMGFTIKMNTWKLYSLGDVPKIFRYTDGNDMLRVYNADSAECRVGAYSNLACNAPGWNGQLTFGA